MASLLSKERIVGGPEFNRLLAVPPSVAVHLCIGSVYSWSVAGVLGPLAVILLRDRSLIAEINRLAEIVSSDKFVKTFGAGVNDLEILVENKTVTLANSWISRLRGPDGFLVQLGDVCDGDVINNRFGKQSPDKTGSRKTSRKGLVLGAFSSDLRPASFAERPLGLEINAACRVSGRFSRSTP